MTEISARYPEQAQGTIRRERQTGAPPIQIRVLAAGLFAFLLVALVGCATGGDRRDADLSDFGLAPEFALIDQFEQPVHSADLQGDVLVASFIYTSCRDICPVLTARMRSLQDQLRAAGLLDGRVHLLSFSVDPARDTPAVLRAFAERYQADPANWRFLTGPEDVLIPLVVDGFRLGVQALPPPPPEIDHSGHGGGAAPDYEVTHSGRFVLIDREGHIRAYYDGTDVELERVVRDIRALLRSR
ncbi:MAG: SCO family protein [Dehalococcoidia bacterium]